MTVVTTSRKAAPEVRSLAKDLAFALGYPFFTRGKMGLHELNSIDTSFLILSAEPAGTRLQIFSSGEPVADYLVANLTIEDRTGTMSKEVSVTDQSVYDVMKPYIRVAMSREKGGGTMIFDGTRRRRYLLGLKPYGIQCGTAGTPL
jgi:U3 small nucleolar ribonucleoprotein protein IMP4